MIFCQEIRLSAFNVRELKRYCEHLGVDVSSCVEKGDLMTLALGTLVYDFAFKMMDFAFKMMDFALKMMDFALKMMNSGRTLWTRVLRLLVGHLAVLLFGNCTPQIHRA